jgi:hypothetical protein
MKKKALLLMFFLMLISTNALSQNTIYGTVGSVSSGDVLEGVTVEIYKVNCGDTNAIAELITDSDGNYSSLSLVDGRYLVYASKDGYSVIPNSHDVQIPQTVIQPYHFIAIEIPRFTDNLDGTVTDALTGIVWLKNANCFGSVSWDNAEVLTGLLKNGWCELSDGSIEGDWRLPTIEELQGIGTDPPETWETGTPSDPDIGITWTRPYTHFENLLYDYYWSGTEFVDGEYKYSKALLMGTGHTLSYPQLPFYECVVWAVRSDN